MWLYSHLRTSGVPAGFWTSRSPAVVAGSVKSKNSKGWLINDVSVIRTFGRSTEPEYDSASTALGSRRARVSAARGNHHGNAQLPRPVQDLTRSHKISSRAIFRETPDMDPTTTQRHATCSSSPTCHPTNGPSPPAPSFATGYRADLERVGRQPSPNASGCGLSVA